MDLSGNVLARYTATTDIDEPLSELRGGTTSYYQQDAISSVTSLSNSGGAVANTYTYDSYGKLTASTGTVTNPFQYTARELDSETGIYEYRARYYEPLTGRFISEDPIRFKGGKNFYVYAANSPTGNNDPYGLQAKKPCNVECVCERVNAKPIGGRCLYSCQCPDGGEPFVFMQYYFMAMKCHLSLKNPKACPLAITVEQFSKNEKTGLGSYGLVACGPFTRGPGSSSPVPQ